MNGTDQSVSLHKPASSGEWAAYHDIRRRILFENRGRFGVYDPHRPDEHRPDNFPLLLSTIDGFVGVIRIDVRGDVALFRRVAIDSPWQRRGLGRKLLELAEAFARDHGAKRAESAVAPDAVPFYEKCGYHRLHGVTPIGESVKMAKEL